MRLAQHRRVVELGIATDLASDQIGKIGAGQSVLGGIEAVTGPAGRKQALAVLCGFGAYTYELALRGLVKIRSSAAVKD